MKELSQSIIYLNKYILILFAWVAVCNFAFSQDPQWKHQIEAEGSYAIPSGDFNTLVTLQNGIGGSVTYFYRAGQSWFLSANVGYYPFAFSTGPSVFEVIPVLVGIKYNLVTRGVQPYFSAEAGLFFTSQNNSVTTTSDSVLRFGIVPRFGARYPISGGLDVDVSLKHNAVLGYDPSFGFTTLNLGFAYTIDRIKSEIKK